MKNGGLKIVVAALYLLTAVFSLSPATKVSADPAVPGESIYNIRSNWMNQNGEPIALAKFRGKPLVLAMIFTRCQGACPLLVHDMQRIERALPPSLRDRVQFALVSFDPQRDTSNRLRDFAKSHDLNQKSWTLLTGRPPSVRVLAAALGVRYEKDADGDFTHSNEITVLDSEGLIRYQREGLGQGHEEAVQAVVKLASGN